LFYLYGPPRSGKGTFTETMRDLLGTPLSEAISFGILTAQRDVDTQNFLLAPLHSSRFISASETNQYERFNEAKLKTITGGDSISCSFKHKTPFSYRPQFKIWLASNQPVNADPDDDATWGRLRVVRFPNSKLGEEDKDLKEKMRTTEVLEGVLAWAVEGAIEWYKLGNKGLPELEDSTQTKMAHRTDLDNVQAWIDENCQPTDAFCAYSLLYGNYESWCKNNGVEQKKQKGFSQSLIRKGYVNKAARDGDKVTKGFVGLKIR
jgi:putative DNA primase/helicase